MKSETIKVRMMNPREMRRYDALDKKWACRAKLSRAQLEWLMNNRARFEVTTQSTRSSPL